MDEQEQQVRRRRTREEVDRLAAEYETSGLARQEFCNRKGVPIKTLARYVARHRKKRTDKGGAQRWVAVEVAERQGHGDELSVVLGSGRRIAVKRGFDADTLRRLVMELERA